MMRVHRNTNYIQVCTQAQAMVFVPLTCSWVAPLTMKLGTLMYHYSSPKQKLLAL